MLSDDIFRNLITVCADTPLVGGIPADEAAQIANDQPSLAHQLLALDQASRVENSTQDFDVATILGYRHRASRIARSEHWSAAASSPRATTRCAKTASTEVGDRCRVCLRMWI